MRTAGPVRFLGDDVFTVTESRVVGYDPATGAERWTINVDIRPGCIDGFAATDNEMYLSTIDCGGNDPLIVAPS